MRTWKRIVVNGQVEIEWYDDGQSEELPLTLTPPVLPVTLTPPVTDNTKRHGRK